MTEIFYKIRDIKTGNYVDILLDTGKTINSHLGKKFNSYGEACSYVSQVQHVAFKKKVYFKISRFIVEEHKTVVYDSRNLIDNTEQFIIQYPDDEESLMFLRAILTQAVYDGFSVMSHYLLNFVLTYDKYQPILNELVPHHMLNSVSEFIEFGINKCPVDSLGSISFTASEEHLKMYDIIKKLQIRTLK